MDEASIDSPLGACRLIASRDGLLSLSFLDEGERAREPSPRSSNPHLLAAIEQLEAYFAGQLTRFSCQLAPQGTAFQRRVWERLAAIPFGVTKSYGQIAEEIGQPLASRAVGGANNRNPIPILIPCHRVIGSKNALVGFGCGLWRKQWMLEHEGIALPLARS
ncbi:methylated-DNA--[protein]-cysteine S-methyltransferase [Pelagicoccus sp. SDUM812005]|uniref:methylated-DNA--[protein]-cysteine S-methyltransferase n=1 Tax=Pelagicoccus sp. SDUM812005 TaxID=3041257 RepID=UPI00280E81EA|nr:methylated-DNA--[protein]-cysteine S-methyltransferase [Pelagicoccus sp. SDUM812005]MDQ8180502.1 methylated-DNA--[protein]-cysteine S-methyltransferase [Pelagicoccus sp. SDUM812005]